MNIPLDIAFVIVSVHFIADFVLQNDWMALGKSKKFFPLFTHVGVYTLVLSLVTGAYDWAIINGILHFFVDYFTSRVNSKLWEKKMVHYFFVGVGFDQLIHYICLFATLQSIT